MEEIVFLGNVREHGGYAIYRTVYALESDLLRDDAMAKLAGYVYGSIWWSIWDEKHRVDDEEGRPPLLSLLWCLYCLMGDGERPLSTRVTKNGKALLKFFDLS